MFDSGYHKVCEGSDNDYLIQAMALHPAKSLAQKGCSKNTSLRHVGIYQGMLFLMESALSPKAPPSGKANSNEGVI